MILTQHTENKGAQCSVNKLNFQMQKCPTFLLEQMQSDYFLLANRKEKIPSLMPPHISRLMQ